MSSIVLSSSSLIHSSASSNLPLNCSGVFFSSIITSVWHLLVFSVSVEVLTVFVHSFPEFSGHFYDLTFHIIPGRLCVLGFFSSFSEVLSCSSDGDLFLCLLGLPNSLFSVLVSGVSQLPLPDLKG